MIRKLELALSNRIFWRYIYYRLFGTMKVREGKDSLLAETITEVKYQVSKGRWVSDQLYCINPLTELVLRRYMRMKRGVFLDIGAFVGRHSLEVARQSRSNKVYAIEPNPLSFRLLKRNIGLNSFGKQITPIKAALSADDCKIRFIVDGAVSRISSGNPSGSVAVDSLSLKTLIRKNGINQSRICLIKIDVEGREHCILEQICKVLSRNKSLDVVCEIQPTARTKKKSLELMSSQGFRIRRIDDSNYHFSKRV